MTYSTIIAKIAALDMSKNYFVQLGILCVFFQQGVQRRKSYTICF